jgi:hypothetical protein
MPAEAVDGKLSLVAPATLAHDVSGGGRIGSLDHEAGHAPANQELGLSRTLIDRCIQASELCALACEAALATDTDYTSPGTDPYSKPHLAMVSCASVCGLVSRALREGDADLELVRWCAEMCIACATPDMPPGVHSAAWSLVVRVCRRCAMECNALVDAVDSTAQSAIDATRDSGFQILT